ncbi:MAG: hypothetical protein V4456_07650 [Bacteroidota bacterium]
MYKPFSRALFFALVCLSGITLAQTPALKKTEADARKLKDSLQHTLNGDTISGMAKKTANATVDNARQALGAKTSLVKQQATQFFSAPGQAKKAFKKVTGDSLRHTLSGDTISGMAKKTANAAVDNARQALGAKTSQVKQQATQFFSAPGQAKKAFKKATDSLANLKQLRKSLGLSVPDVSGIKGAVSLANTKSAVRSRVGETSKGILSKAKKFLNPDLGLKMTIEDAVRYQPVPNLGALRPVKFANVIGANGTITAFGVPVNLDISTDRASSMPGGGLYNDLFKFDFDPKSLKEAFRSDLQQYADVKNQFLGGKDISTFAKSQLDEKIYSKTSGFKSAIKNKQLTAFLNKPANIQELLTLDRAAMTKKLQQQAGGVETAATATSGKLMASLQEIQNANSLRSTLLAKKEALAGISNNVAINSYFNDPANIDHIRYMTKEQISGQLLKLEGADSSHTHATLNTAVKPPVEGGSILPDSLVAAQSAKDTVVSELAQEIFINARAGDKVNLTRQINGMDAGIAQNIASLGNLVNSPNGTPVSPLVGKALSKFNTDIEIEKVAASLTEVKNELQSKGLDVNKMVEMQRFLNEGDFRAGASELGGRLMGRTSGGPAQHLFGNIDALKLGAFSNHVPGATNDQDLFLKGGSVTLRTGRTPLTFGYGSVNDMSAGKDAGFQGSVFNAPRNVTFISADFRRSGKGNLKVSMISSVSRQIKNELYLMPSISSNNVALTVSKGLDIGKMGMLDFEASKSSTLYANKYQSGALAALDARNGVKTDVMGDLYNSLALGVSHRLDLTSVGASDNFYFKYSGVGYQNPANNGFGGARMKFGGNIRKTLYNNRVMLNLRSDISNMPISYSSNDRWKTFQVQMDSRFMVSKSFNVNLRYANNGTDKRVEGISSRVYSFQKFQVDGNASYKIGRKFSVSHFSLGTQAVSNTPISGQSDGGSRLLLLNYVQTMVMKKNVLSFNLLYNRELTPVHLIGDMLNTDISYQFTLFRKMSFTSGATFFDNSGIARQAGLKQSVQLFSAGHFDFGTYVDVRKNLIKPLYADLYPSCRAEFNLKYHLNAL